MEQQKVPRKENQKEIGSEESVRHQIISITKSIVFGTTHSLNSRPQLNLGKNGVAVEHVEETKLHVIILDCKL